jgi:hypothetical protein
MLTVDYKTVAKSAVIQHVVLNQNKGERSRGVYHIQDVNAYHCRLKGWMQRFRGVATKYLDNYMTWFAYIDMTRAISSGTCERRFLAMSCIDNKKVQYKHEVHTGTCLVCTELILKGQDVGSIFYVSHETEECEPDLLCHAQCYNNLTVLKVRKTSA